MSGAGKERRPVTFSADGRTIEAREGQSVGAALWAHGDRVLSRSTKYHRPRGWACGTGKCGNCLMRIDGMPNRRACMETVRDGMNVEGQNAWPSVRHDVWRANDIVFRRGIDHHRGFVRPRLLYPLYSQVIRAFAGWGRLPETVPPAPRATTRRAEVVVVGAGPAGLAAASAAAAAGAQVLLLDEHAEPGGAAIWLTRRVIDPDEPSREVSMRNLVERWRGEAERAGVELLPRTTLAAAYPGGLLLAHASDTITAIKSRATVVATGGIPSEALFGNNDLPGVMTTAGCLTLLNREGVQPGRRAIVYGAGAHGLATALELHAAGIAVRRVVEPAGEVPGPHSLLADVERARIPVATGTRIKQAHGWARVRAATLLHENGAEERIKADLVVVALGHKTLPIVFQSMGARLTHDRRAGGAIPILDDEQCTTVPGLYAAGDAGGISHLAGARESGKTAGRAAARFALQAPPEPDGSSKAVTPEALT